MTFSAHPCDTPEYFPFRDGHVIDFMGGLARHSNTLNKARNGLENNLTHCKERTMTHSRELKAGAEGYLLRHLVILTHNLDSITRLSLGAISDGSHLFISTPLMEALCNAPVAEEEETLDRWLLAAAWGCAAHVAGLAMDTWPDFELHPSLHPRNTLDFTDRHTLSDALTGHTSPDIAAELFDLNHSDERALSRARERVRYELHAFETRKDTLLHPTPLAINQLKNAVGVWAGEHDDEPLYSGCISSQLRCRLYAMGDQIDSVEQVVEMGKTLSQQLPSDFHWDGYAWNIEGLFSGEEKSAKSLVADALIYFPGVMVNYTAKTGKILEVGTTRTANRMISDEDYWVRRIVALNNTKDTNPYDSDPQDSQFILAALEAAKHHDVNIVRSVLSQTGGFLLNDLLLAEYIGSRLNMSLNHLLISYGDPETALSAALEEKEVGGNNAVWISACRNIQYGVEIIPRLAHVGMPLAKSKLSETMFFPLGNAFNEERKDQFKAMLAALADIGVSEEALLSSQNMSGQTLDEYISTLTGKPCAITKEAIADRAGMILRANITTQHEQHTSIRRRF